MTEENNIPEGFKRCECKPDCPDFIPIKDKWGRLKRFKNGHQGRGKNNSNYNGGRRSRSKVYVSIKMPDHPNCDIDGYVRQHRAIYENYLFIILDEEVYIPSDWDVHHKKPVKEGGTNALDNLELLSHAEHMRIHRTIDTSNRHCLLCGGKTYTKKDGREDWFVYQNGFICRKCHDKKRRKKL